MVLVDGDRVDGVLLQEADEVKGRDVDAELLPL